jgi:hypothetical protein
LEVSASPLAAFLAELLADALLDALALFAAADLFDPSFSVGPCPLSQVDAALWLAAFAVLAAFAEALFVELEVDVSLLVLALFAEAVWLAAADFTSLACAALLDVEAFVVEFDLLALFEAEEVSEEAEVLLALAC